MEININCTPEEMVKLNDLGVLGSLQVLVGAPPQTAEGAAQERVGAPVAVADSEWADDVRICPFCGIKTDEEQTAEECSLAPKKTES